MAENISEDRVLGRIGITLKGEYDNNKTYTKLNQVTYNGGSYTLKVKKATGILPTNTDYWVCSAKPGEKGDKGDTGEKGETGATGAKGEKGDKGDTGAQGIQGIQGEKGDKPVKGVDYFTEEEKTEFKNAVVADSKTEIDTYTETKINEYNDNTTEKIGTFNSNAQAKTEEFNENVESYKSRITELEGIVSQLPAVEDSGSDFKLDNTIDAQILDNKVTGATWQESYEGYNLAAINNLDEPYTHAGVTFSKTEDGGIKVEGTATATTGMNILTGGALASNSNNPIQINSNETICLSGCPANGGSNTYKFDIQTESGYTELVDLGAGAKKTFAASSSITKMRIVIYTDVSINAVFYPMLTKSTDFKPFEPYVGGTASPNVDFPQEIHNVSGDIKIKEYNKNFYVVPDNFTKTQSGVTLEVAENGDLVLNGTATMDDNIKINEIKLDEGMYTLSADKETKLNGSSNALIQLYDNENNQVIVLLHNNTSLVQTKSIVSGTFLNRVRIEKNRVYNNYKIEKLQLEKGSAVTKYEKRKETSVTFPLAENQHLAEGDCLAEDGIHYKIAKITITGADNFAFDINMKRLRLTISNAKVFSVNNFSMLSNKFHGTQNVFDSNLIQSGDMGQYKDTKVFYFGLPKNLTTNEQVAEWLNNNHIDLQYELEEEIVEAYTEEQQTAYEQIKKLRSHADVTYVVTSSDDLAPVVEVKALEKVAGISEIDNIKQAIVALGGTL